MGFAEQISGRSPTKLLLYLPGCGSSFQRSASAAASAAAARAVVVLAPHRAANWPGRPLQAGVLRGSRADRRREPAEVGGQLADTPQPTVSLKFSGGSSRDPSAQTDNVTKRQYRELPPSHATLTTDDPFALIGFMRYGYREVTSLGLAGHRSAEQCRR